MFSARARAAFRWLGLLLSVGALGFIALRFRELGHEASGLDLPARSLFLLALLAGGYAAANLPLAAAWRNLLAHLGERRSFRWAFRVYALSQIAKYIPGNVFHLAGRQAIGMADGVAPGRLAKSALWELGAIAVAALSFAALVLPLANPLLPIALFAVLLAALGAAAARLISTPVAGALGWYALFLLVSAALFFAILVLLDPAVSPSPTTVCAAYVAAWLAGMATPGAPAGVGVREVVLYGMLQGSVGQADLLLAILLSRLVTAGGDLLLYLAATLLPAREA